MDRVDNLLGQDDVERFLRGLGLHVASEVVHQVLAVLEGEAGSSLYQLYAARGGRSPICGKGTVYKIKKLYEEGKLDPFVDYAFPAEARDTMAHDTESSNAALGSSTTRPATSSLPIERTTADPELGPHRRKLFYLGQRLRDRLGVDQPRIAVESILAGGHDGLWLGRQPREHKPRDAEEEIVESEWGIPSYEAHKHSLFSSFEQHLAGNPC